MSTAPVWDYGVIPFEAHHQPYPRSTVTPFSP
jgi:hypothetical protein